MIDHDRIDAIVNDPCLLPYRGWHGDHAGPVADYRPAIQQDRAEFLAFLDAMDALDVLGNVLTLGLGPGGAMHLVFEDVSGGNATTVDGDAACVARLAGLNTLGMVWGDTRSHATWAAVREGTPYSLLFVDAGHDYGSVVLDHRDYAPLVRSGGVVAFHDHHDDYPGVKRVVAQLDREGRDCQLVSPYALGIAWYRVP